jgi:hypothetical protein
VGRQDHLVGRLKAREDCSHLERGCAGVGQQGVPAESLLQPHMAFERELSVSRQMPRVHGLFDVLKLAANKRWTIDWDHDRQSSCIPSTEGSSAMLLKYDRTRHQFYPGFDPAIPTAAVAGQAQVRAVSLAQ